MQGGKHFLSLRANQQAITRQQAVMALINGLPSTFDLSRTGLIANCIMADFPEVLETVGHVAVGIKFNDRVPRPVPKAAVATAPQVPNPAKNSRSTSRTSAHKSTYSQTNE
jgi:hypothetical protein